MFFRIRTYLRYYFRSKRRGHGVHSPFVYALSREVFPDKELSPEHPAEKLRREMLQHTGIIQVLDLGTGRSGPRKISEIARRAAKSPEAGRLLHRIVQRFQPAYMLELGTSLGISSLYQQHKDQQRFVSIEGCPETAAQARKNLEGTKAEIVNGDFSEQLPAVLAAFPQLDYVYFDGNHRRDPTLEYFETCLPFANPESIFIFDDIHWSPEMEQAWEKIKTDPRVTVTIDLYEFGLVFFRSEQVKENFVLKS